MNAPDRHEILVVPEGQKKVELVKDTRLPNAATITIQREDHTLGNLIRAYTLPPTLVIYRQLLNHKSITFAGYRMPHPLVPAIELRVHTKKDSTPAKALSDSLNTLIVDLGTLKSQFEDELKRVNGNVAASGW